MIWIERRHIYLAALVLGILLLMGGIFILVTNRLEKRLLEELKKTHHTLEQIKENELLLAQDLNHARAVLGLQVRTYDFLLREEKEPSPEKTASSPLFQAVDTILSRKEQQERETFLMGLLRSPEVMNLIKTQGMELKKEQGKIEIQKKGVPYFSFTLPTESSKDKSFAIESYIGRRLAVDAKEPSISQISSFLQEQSSLLEAHFHRIQQLKSQLLSTCTKTRIQSLASEKGLFLSKEEESADGIRLRYLLKVEPTLSKLEVGLQYRKGVFFIEKETFDAVGTFEERLAQALRNADTRTSKEMRLDSILSSLRAQMKDTGFQRYLQSKKVSISDRERDTEEYRFIDLLEEKGKRIGSIGILKARGDVSLFDKDDVFITSLKMFTIPVPLQDKKKSLSQDSP